MWFETYTAKYANIQFNYQSIGSGGGVAQITQQTVDFGASDAALKDEEVAKLPAGTKILHVPTALGAVVVIYNLPGIDKLQLDSANIADIFLGNITKWNDAKIAANNAGVTLPDQAIQSFHRQDGSGTTNAQRRALERARRATVAGAIVNKVDLDAKPGLARTLKHGLARHGVPAGRAAVPAHPLEPDARHGPRGRPRRDAPSRARPRPGIGGVAIGAMEPEPHAGADRATQPGDRPGRPRGRHRGGIVRGPAPRGAPGRHRSARGGPRGRRSAAGLGSLSGGYRPSDRVIESIRRADLFATLVPEDTYAVASEVHDLLVKTHPADVGKMAEIEGRLLGVPVLDRVWARPRTRRCRRRTLRVRVAPELRDDGGALPAAYHAAARGAPAPPIATAAAASHPGSTPAAGRPRAARPAP